MLQISSIGRPQTGVDTIAETSMRWTTALPRQRARLRYLYSSAMSGEVELSVRKLSASITVALTLGGRALIAERAVSPRTPGTLLTSDSRGRVSTTIFRPACSCKHSVASCYGAERAQKRSKRIWQGCLENTGSVELQRLAVRLAASSNQWLDVSCRKNRRS